jgi:23S rRNA (guanosine2251-2'-O)-methyltransferase
VRSSRPLKAGRPARPRAEDGGNWIWGLHAARAALANPARRIERVVATRNAAQHLAPAVAFDLLAPDAIDRLLPPGAVHQGLAVRAAALEPATLHEACAPPDGRPVVVLDQVTDPQNVGAVFRCAAAFGARAVVMQDRKAPPLTGALAKAAAGAIEAVPEVRVVNIAQALRDLAELGYRTIGLDADAEETIAEAARGDQPIALVLGAEGKGLRDLVAATCERRARIPMAPAMENLNVAAAAAVALYAVSTR